jgi:predicted RNA-binding protein with PUA-like domain
MPSAKKKTTKKAAAKPAASASVTANEAPAGRRFWLLKSEPDCFSIRDLEAAPGKTTFWDGVRNYQARNFLRDAMRVGDGVLFYHSNAEPPGVAGLAEVVRTGYPDFTAFDPKHEHYDPDSDPTAPTWYMVDVRHVRTFAEPIPLPSLRTVKGLERMMVLQKGSRLSVQPVTAEEWEIISKLGK